MRYKEELDELMEVYRSRGVARDQNELVQMLREAQMLCGGVIPQKALEEIAQKLEIKMTFIDAVLKRYASIKVSSARHLLTICGDRKCIKGAQLADFIEREYCVRPGGISQAGFRYRVAGCMKACGKGPCIKWDGKLYTDMTVDRLRHIVSEKS
nr:NAD(P)H-dependent oxidoreductase subunit E [uncultured Agathobaculum sp.]